MKQLNYMLAGAAGMGALLSVLTGCHVDEDVLVGKQNPRPSYSPYSDYSSTCEGPGYGFTYRVDANYFEGNTQNCASPEGTLSRVEEGDDGSLKVWVRRMSDGNFPVLQYLVFSERNPYGNLRNQVQMTCQSGPESADGGLKELTCSAGPSERRLSVSNLSNHDIELNLQRMMLLNPSCGASLRFEANVTGYSTCSYIDRQNSMRETGRTFDGVYFPSMFTERYE